MSNTSMNTEYGQHRTGGGELRNLREYLNEDFGAAPIVNAGDSLVAGGLIYPVDDTLLPLGSQSSAVPQGVTRLKVDTGVGDGELLYLWEPSGSLPNSSFVITDIRSNNFSGYIFTIDGNEYEFTNTETRSLRKADKISGYGLTDGSDLAPYLSEVINRKINKIVLDKNHNITTASLNLDYDLHIIQEENVTSLHTGNVNFDFVNPNRNPLTLDSGVGELAWKGGFKTFTDVSGIKPGDMIQVQNDQRPETVYNYSKQWSTTVSIVDNNVVFFDTQSKFDFTLGGTTNYYHVPRVVLTWEGLKQNTEVTTALGFGIRFFDMTPKLTNVSQINSDQVYAINFTRCASPVIDGFNLKRGTYGCLMNGGHNGVFRNITCSGVRHPIATSGWPDTVHVDTLKGSCGVIESHPAFDVHYNNIDLLTGTPADDSVANLRSIGGSIKNSVLRHTKRTGVTPNEIFIQLIQNLIPTEEYLWDSAVFTMENVDWYRAVNSNAQEELPLDIYSGGEVHLSNIHTGGRVAVGIPTAQKDIINKVFIDNVTSDAMIVGVRGEEVLNTSQEYQPIEIAPDTYFVNMLNVAQDTKKTKIEGRLYRGSSTGSTKNLVFRLQPSIEVNNPSLFVNFLLGIKSTARHTSAGSWATKQKIWNGYIKNNPSYDAQLPTTPVYENSSSGQDNESGHDIVINSISYIDNGGSTYDNYIEIDLTVSMTGVSNPVIRSIDYELELFYE